jgi:hypothetical protein
VPHVGQNPRHPDGANSHATKSNIFLDARQIVIHRFASAGSVTDH